MLLSGLFIATATIDVMIVCFSVAWKNISVSLLPLVRCADVTEGLFALLPCCAANKSKAINNGELFLPDEATYKSAFAASKALS